MAKPANPVVLDLTNPLIRNPVTCYAFTEGAGTARDLVTGRGQPVFWSSNADGFCIIPGTSPIPGINVGVSGQDGLTLPTGDCTVVMVRRKTDTTLRGVYHFGMQGGIGGLQQTDPGGVITPSLLTGWAPFSDGVVYWDYGGNSGANRLTWGGYAPSTNLEYWTFVAGTSGMAIYFNGSVVATTGTAVSRTNNALNQLSLAVGARGDQQQLSMFMVLATEWSASDVATWNTGTYAFLTAGTPTPLAIQKPAPVQAVVGSYPYFTAGTAGAATQLGGIYRTCHAGENLQGKLAEMQSGDVLMLDAGATFTSTVFTVPVVAGNTTTSGWCAIISSNDALLPGGGYHGQRVEPIDAVNMPKVLTNNNGGSFNLSGAAHGWIFRGIEMGADGTYALPTIVSGINMLGGYVTPGPAVTYRTIIDRCYIHHRYTNISTNHIRTGILVTGADVRICGNYICDLQDDGQDTAAVYINGSPGPVLIENNFMAATGMGVYTGGSYPPNAQPSVVNVEGDTYSVHDLIVRRNYITKLKRWQGNSAFVPPTAQQFNSPFWDGTNWDVKPTLELKEAIRCLIDANTFDNSFNWPAVVFDAWNQGSTEHGASGGEDASYDTLAHLSDLLVFGNRIRKGCNSPFQVYTGNRPILRVMFQHNLGWGSYILAGKQVLGQQPGNFFYISPSPVDDVADLIFDHNTTINDRNAGTFGSSSLGPMHRLQVTNNIVGYGHGGVFNEALGSASPAADSLFDKNVGDRVFAQHAMVDFGDAVGGTRDPLYTTTNWGPGAAGVADGQYIIAGTPAACGINQQTGRLTAGGLLTAGQSYQATDGTDNGVDWRYVTNPATRWPTATATPAATLIQAATLTPQGT